MRLALPPPLPPMEAQSADTLPKQGQWQYEPKWDGFRCLAFRDGDEVELQSKSCQPLTRYFPELVETLRSVRAEKFVLDGEIVVPVEGRLSFDALLQRIHPAESRVRKLAAETPAELIAFDLLLDADGTPLVDRPLRERRPLLERFHRTCVPKGAALRLSSATTDPAEARRWLERSGGSLDGIICKDLDAPYRSGERTGMLKVKTVRTVDCVVGGFRYGSGAKGVGSLLLGLYDDQGLLHHVGFLSAIRAAERPALTRKLEALVEPPGFTGRAPGGPSRWSAGRSTEWTPLKPVLVVEVAYDHLTGGRFRHGARLVRWRPDKSARQCTFAQLHTAGDTGTELLHRHAA